MNKKYIKKDDGTVWPVVTDDIEWILRYGSQEDIIKHRFYIASIVNAYRQLNGTDGETE